VPPSGVRRESLALGIEKSLRIAPRIPGILLAVAGVAYVFDTLANVLVSNYADYEMVFLLIVALPSIVGELAFTVWLLARAGRSREAVALA
jgi:hypothetical protein